MIKKVTISLLLTLILLVSGSSVYAQSPQAFEHGLNHKLENLPDGKVKWTGLPEVEFVEDEITKEKNPRYKWGKEHKILYNEKKYLKALDKYPAKLAEWEQAGSIEEDKPIFPEPAQFTEPVYEVIAGKDLRTGSQIRGASLQARNNIAEKFGEVGDFVWVDGVGGGGIIILPQGDYDYIYLATGDWANPTIAETDNYEIVGGKTHIYINHFSGGGGVHETGKLVLWYQPNYLISGIVLPDRSYTALSFNGTAEVAIANNAILMPTVALTIESWVKFTSVPVAGHGSIYNKGNQATNDHHWLYWRTDGSWRWELGNGVTTFSLTYSHTPTVGQWYYVVGTYDSADGYFRFYLDGVQRNSHYHAAFGVVGTNGASAYIGSYRSSIHYYNGVIDELRISDIARTPEEILANWNSGDGKSLTPDANTVALWHMDEKRGLQAVDSSGYANTGTITGAFFVDGKVPRTPGEAGENPGTITWAVRSVDSGNTTALIDSELTQSDNYWNAYTMLVTETTDGLAPEGESANITDFDAAGDELVFGALTAGVDPGDSYEIWDEHTIIWGSFPEGILVSLGPILAEEEPVSAPEEVATPEVLHAPTPPTALWGGAAPATLPLYPVFETAAIGLGWSVQTLYVFAVVIVGIGMGVAVLVMTGSVLGALAMCGAAMFMGTAMDILPMWFIIVFGLMTGTYLYSARSM